MVNYLDNIDFQAALDIEHLSRLMYDLRENRKTVLAPYGVSDELALLEQIYTGKLAEHPAYEHYLALRIMAETQESARILVSEKLLEANRS